MRYCNVLVLLAFAMLSACSTTDLALSSMENQDADVGTLKLVWLYPKSAETLLDGKRYAGEWSDRRCLTSECRGEYENVQGVHRSHIRKGVALLIAQDNSRLACEWVSHHKEFIGSCRNDAGKHYRLQAAPSS